MREGEGGERKGEVRGGGEWVVWDLVNVGVGGVGYRMGNGRAWGLDLRCGPETEGVGVEG